MKVVPVRSWKVHPAEEGFTTSSGLLQFRLMLLQDTGHTLKSRATVNEQLSLQPEELSVAIIQYVPSGSPDTVCWKV